MKECICQSLPVVYISLDVNNYITHEQVRAVLYGMLLKYKKPSHLCLIFLKLCYTSAVCVLVDGFCYVSSHWDFTNSLQTKPKTRWNHS